MNFRPLRLSADQKPTIRCWLRTRARARFSESGPSIGSSVLFTVERESTIDGALSQRSPLGIQGNKPITTSENAARCRRSPDYWIAGYRTVESSLFVGAEIGSGQCSYDRFQPTRRERHDYPHGHAGRGRSQSVAILQR